MTGSVERPALKLTAHLDDWKSGQPEALGVVYELAEKELRVIARQRLARADGERLAVTPGDLLQEALLKVMQQQPDFNGSGHFMATMSLIMRNILIDAARSRAAAANGGQAGTQLTFTESLSGAESDTTDLIALDEALKALEVQHPRVANTLHLTYFAGLTAQDIADTTDISVATVERDLKFGRAWVIRCMKD